MMKRKSETGLCVELMKVHNLIQLGKDIMPVLGLGVGTSFQNVCTKSSRL